MLGHLRVIDLTGGSEQICGQILGDLGADVILVEPPGGCATRGWAPFAADQPGPERSLVFWAYNRNKRSVIADMETHEGRARIKALVQDADIVIEAFAPGHLASHGLGYGDLAAINPAVVLMSITPFGQTGPKADWAASDLTALAASVTLQITGDDDRAPSRVSVPQAFLHAGAEAAVGALIAYAGRLRDGVGQHVDVSAQAATAMATQSWILHHGWGESEMLRLGGGIQLGPIRLKLVNPCKDGFVSVTFLFGSAIGPFSRRLMEAMYEEGFVDEATRDKDWLNYTTLLVSGAEPLSELDRCIDCITNWTMAHTKAELFALALERSLLIVPVATTKDVCESPQLAARQYWRTVESPTDGSPVTFPGPFAQFSGQPLRYRRRAPRLGEHTAEVSAAPPLVRPPFPAPAPSTAGPLNGLRVLDFMWVMAGPAATRYLSDYGATVVRVESSTRVDTARTIGPFKDGVPGGERSGLFAAMNAGKLGITINPKTAAGHALALKLVRWADVVAESYSPRAMRSWGLDYESLRKVNPGIVMISSCLSGQTGPHAGLAGFGTMGAQIAGFGELAGWPDRPPAGPFGAYTDYIAPKFTTAALLAALEHRRVTGEGQYIDVSQAEASLHFLGPAILDYTVNRRVMSRMGNQSREWAPHAVFPCAGNDRWVAIAVETDEQWHALCAVIGRDDWAANDALRSAAGRLAHRDELEGGIAAWTATRTQDDVEDLLQSVRVPCHRSSRSIDAFSDPQLAHRGHFVTVEHPELGPVPIEGSRMHLSRTPAQVLRAGPTLGQDNDLVLREILGLNDDEIVELVTAGALE
jgi:crotonobetainyl-CoA:carnitine CoA-transferase CaiB-like acyl-CoA transferase